MEINKLSDRNIRLLNEIYKKGSVTSATQSIYGGLGFYTAKDFLLKKGLIQQNGTNEKNQIIFTLTEKGKKLVQLINKVEMLLGVEDAKSGNTVL